MGGGEEGGQGGATGHRGIQVREGLRGVTGPSGSLVGSDDFTVALAHPLLQRPAERRGFGFWLASPLKCLRDDFEDSVFVFIIIFILSLLFSYLSVARKKGPKRCLLA